MLRGILLIARPPLLAAMQGGDYRSIQCFSPFKVSVTSRSGDEANTVHSKGGVCLGGGIGFPFQGQWLVYKHVKDALADFALMQMTPFAFVELNVAGGGFKQPAVLDMVYNERLHGRVTCKLRSERILRIFFRMNLLLTDEMAVEFH